MEMRQRHRAIDCANIDLVWPQEAHPPPSKSIKISKYFDNRLDQTQKYAVEAFVSGYNRNVPFLLFGPFGTGKTRTVIEIVNQLAQQNKKVLVCTKSNSACDTIVRQLAANIPPTRMFRLMALHRQLYTVKKNKRNYNPLLQKLL